MLFVSKAEEMLVEEGLLVFLVLISLGFIYVLSLVRFMKYLVGLL